MVSVNIGHVDGEFEMKSSQIRVESNQMWFARKIPHATNIQEKLNFNRKQDQKRQWKNEKKDIWD